MLLKRTVRCYLAVDCDDAGIPEEGHLRVHGEIGELNRLDEQQQLEERRLHDIQVAHPVQNLENLHLHLYDFLRFSG